MTIKENEKFEMMAPSAPTWPERKFKEIPNYKWNSIKEQAYLHLRDNIKAIGGKNPGLSFGYYNQKISICQTLPEKLLLLNPPALKIYLRCLKFISRKRKPEEACVIQITIIDFEDLLKESSYKKGVKELLRNELLVKTPDKETFIVNIEFANKLNRPKYDDFPDYMP
jgi:hypothetical protein